jgi:hypothetical protein
MALRNLLEDDIKYRNQVGGEYLQVQESADGTALDVAAPFSSLTLRAGDYDAYHHPFVVALGPSRNR